MENLSEIKKKLLSSDSIKSLIIESTVFNFFEKQSWQTEHSPYFLDSNSKKLRELDVKARKYFKKDGYSSDVDILIECKSLNRYHIIANNKSTPKNDFDFIWMGNYVDNDFNRLDELLLKYNFTSEEIIYIKQKLYEYCVPNNTFKWLDYKLQPFEIPTFNAYRETNINTTKDIDNSVIWKCIMSLQSAINAHEELLLLNIDYCINENIHHEFSRIKKIELLIKDLINRSNHIYFIHPVIIVESKLWEFKDNKDLEELKYFRLNIQHFFTDGFWVDVVNFEHVEEYLEKSKNYIEFHKKLKFEI